MLKAVMSKEAVTEPYFLHYFELKFEVLHKPLAIFFVCVLLLTSCKNNQQAEPIKPDEPQEEKVNIDVSKEIICGYFDPSRDSNYVRVDIKYADRDGMYLHKEAYDKFIDMWNAASKDGVKLVIRSATRNFNYQKGIWERKWFGHTILSDGTNAADITNDSIRALKILEYSAMPGTSRHHWGTEVDLNSFENSWFEEGEGLILYNWLELNAASFGFCRPYTSKPQSRPNGYNEEKWHWSYVPISKHYTAFAKNNLLDSDIRGFEGSKTAEQISVVTKYVLGINEDCNL